jgi:hypothetical protein
MWRSNVHPSSYFTRKGSVIDWGDIDYEWPLIQLSEDALKSERTSGQRPPRKGRVADAVEGRGSLLYNKENIRL